jgi:hypothetical protein
VSSSDGNLHSPPPERIAPPVSTIGAVAFNSSALNTEIALNGRFLRAKHPVDYIHGAFYRIFVRAFFGNIFRCVVRASVLPYAAWLKRFPVHRQECLRRAEEQHLYNTRHTSGGFPKREISALVEAWFVDHPSYQEATDKVPRIIAPQDDTTLNVTGPVDAGFHNWLKESWPAPRLFPCTAQGVVDSITSPRARTGVVYVSGVPLHVIGDNHQPQEHVGAAVRETDGSRFDSSMNWATDLVERDVMERAFQLRPERPAARGIDPDVANADSFATTDTARRLDRYFHEWESRSNVRGKTAFGQRYTVRYTRPSGDTATTTRNSVTNGLLHLHSQFAVLCSPPHPCCAIRAQWFERPHAVAARAHDAYRALNDAADAARTTTPSARAAGEEKIVVPKVDSRTAGIHYVYELPVPPADDWSRREYAGAVEWLEAVWDEGIAMSPPILLVPRCTRLWTPENHGYEGEASGLEIGAALPEWRGVGNPPCQTLVTGDDALQYIPPACHPTRHANQLMDSHVMSLGLELKTIEDAAFDNATFCSNDFQRAQRCGVETFALRQQLNRLPRRAFSVDLPSTLDRKSVVAGNVLSTAAADSGNPINEAVASLHARYAGNAKPVFTNAASHRLTDQAGADHKVLQPAGVSPLFYAQIAERTGLTPTAVDAAAAALAAAPARVDVVTPDAALAALVAPVERPLLPPLAIAGSDFVAPFVEELIKLTPLGTYFVVFEALCWLTTGLVLHAVLVFAMHLFFRRTAVMAVAAFGELLFLLPYPIFFEYVVALCVHLSWNFLAVAYNGPLASVRRPAAAALENLQRFFALMPRNGRSSARSHGQPAPRAKSAGANKRTAAGAGAQLGRGASSTMDRVGTHFLSNGKTAPIFRNSRDNVAPARRVAFVENSGAAKHKFLPLVLGAGAIAGAAARVARAAATATGRSHVRTLPTATVDKHPVAGARPGADGKKMPVIHPSAIARYTPAAPARGVDERGRPNWALKWISPVATTHRVGVPGQFTGVAPTGHDHPLATAIKGSKDGSSVSVTTAPAAIGSVMEKGEARTRQARFHRYGEDGKLVERDATLVENCEEYTQVNGVTGFQAKSTGLNPGNPVLVPWMSNMSPNYDEFGIGHAAQQFDTEQASSLAGKLWLEFDYEVTDPAPLNRIQATDLYGEKNAQVWMRDICHYRPSGAQQAIYYVGNPATPAPGTDPRLTTPANVIFCVADTTTATLGDVVIHYGIFLFEPNLITQQNVAINGNLSTYQVTSATVTGGASTSVPQVSGNSPTTVTLVTPPTNALPCTVTFVLPYSQPSSTTYQPTPGSYLLYYNANWLGGGNGAVSGPVTVLTLFGGVALAPQTSSTASGGTNYSYTTGNASNGSTCFARLTISPFAVVQTLPPTAIFTASLDGNGYTASAVTATAGVIAYSNTVTAVVQETYDDGKTLFIADTKVWRRFGVLEADTTLSQMISPVLRDPLVRPLSSLLQRASTKADRLDTDEKRPVSKAAPNAIALGYEFVPFPANCPRPAAVRAK